ncbi:tubulinyl-Tyr carboxypeptidase 2-like isoform X2 [Tubulanus polymorphus]|uniref:tubulinyl-Tyr carboxypeptidase 2-like isoform X2 n=1 Tax=Tubulanus polymorphus TaxID=672921 RepID=UPI003DA4A518
MSDNKLADAEITDAQQKNVSNFGNLVLERCRSRKEQSNDRKDKDSDNVLFWVNRSGFPINDETWDRMWRHIAKLHPEEGTAAENSIRYAQHLLPVAIPTPPIHFPMNTTIPERIIAIQNYMRQLQYNHTGTQFFEIKKYRPISGLMECAKEMIRESLPIKCLEAIILGLYLTNGYPGLERFAISFKSCFAGNFHRHVVLGLYYNGCYGTIGMSRREELMYKPLKFKSLSEVILSYKQSYKKFWHELKKLKIGLPISHDPHSCEQMSWKYLSLNLVKMSNSEIEREVEKHAREMKSHGKSGYGVAHSPRKSVSSPRKEMSVCLKKDNSTAKSKIKNTDVEKSKSHKPSNNEEYQIKI